MSNIVDLSQLIYAIPHTRCAFLISRGGDDFSLAEIAAQYSDVVMEPKKLTTTNLSFQGTHQLTSHQVTCTTFSYPPFPLTDAPVDAANDALAAIQTHDTLRDRHLLTPSSLHQVNITHWYPYYKTMVERNTFLTCYPNATVPGVDTHPWRGLLQLLATPGLPKQRENCRYVIIRYLFPESLAENMIRQLTNPRFIKDRQMYHRKVEYRSGIDFPKIRQRLSGYLMSYYEAPNLCHQVELILAAFVTASMDSDHSHQCPG